MTDQTDPAALVKAAMESAAELARCSDFRYEAYDAIRALADDPEAVAEIIEQAKGETDE